MLSLAVPPTSLGDSKFGATLNVSAPLDEPMLNFDASSPGTIEYVSVLNAGMVSGSLAVTVLAAVVFSGTEFVFVEVNDGASLTFVTVTAMFCTVARPVPL